MANSRENIRIFGGDDDAISVAPKGTVLEPGLAVLPEDWKAAGWLSEDGINWNESQDRTEHRAHQGGRLVRVSLNNETRTFDFQALEENAITLGLYWPGFVPEVVGVGVVGGMVGPTKSNPRGFVIDTYDVGVDITVHQRLWCPDAEVTEKAALSFNRANMTVRGFTVTVYNDFYFWSDNPELVTAFTTTP